ncbi:RNA polymerase sigma factor [Chitinophaga barathri]|uniref:Sigma-70 family RNA polymerase sigma factor n=1 Tax=Chitinophaga barathri TaxID=1647451 RepID=A0A3N4MSB2_9BACT|nr:sigma-70 family RNA polymerase sigma factor [Chitinophaga barathri]RPD43030.1 sigma-70 family RNA polymerase sigma factor [Chitinophaga barathri]
MSNESILLHEIAQGNEKAFRTLFEAYKVKLYNYIFRITKSKEISEEILTDVFLKIWMGRDFITEIRNFEGFIQKVACNKALDFLRVASRHKRLQELIERELMAGESALDQAVIEREYQLVLHKAMEQLSPQRRLIFSLSRDYGFSHEEIAVRLNLSRHTVRNTVVEALKTVRSYLKSQDIIKFFSFL